MKNILFYPLILVQLSLFSAETNKKKLTIIANENNEKTCSGWTLTKTNEIKERKCLFFGTIKAITTVYSAIHECQSNPQQGQVASITIRTGRNGPEPLEVILSNNSKEDTTYNSTNALIAGITVKALRNECACIKLETIEFS